MCPSDKFGNGNTCMVDLTIVVSISSYFIVTCS